MPEVVIRVEGLGKRYRIGARQKKPAGRGASIRRLLVSPFTYLRTTMRPPTEEETLWALKNVSFEVKQGEVIGIVGRNGAGKSTLLKVLSRITEPTEGRATIRGRVSSLLEVGTGFHPELTGRENIYLSGAILGMKKVETDRKFDEIVSFSEIEQFIDTPVKRYSSGMYVRLAFSVAAHLEPQILMVDEVLAVGDVDFQKKCLGKMEQAATGGRTVLFVSHNMSIISTLCEKVMVLSQGRVSTIGPTQQAIGAYLAQFGADATSKRSWSFDDAPGGENVKIRGVTVTAANGIPKQHYSTTEPVFATIEYWVLTDDVPVNANLHLFDQKNNHICSVANYSETRSNPIKKRGLYRSRCVIPGHFLNSGPHTIEPILTVDGKGRQVHVRDRVAFETLDEEQLVLSRGQWRGIVKPDFHWVTEKIGES